MASFIRKMVVSALCTGCGTCAGICPKHAIKMTISNEAIYIPKVDSSKCNECALCVKVCPGYLMNFRKLNLEIFNKVPNDLVLGNALHYYAGYSTNHHIRLDSSSGGIITSLLIFALREGIIDGALVTKMSKTNPLMPLPFIAKTEKDILSARGSKYCPVPVNSLLRNILEQEGTFAIVGLPCHIHGIRKAQQVLKVKCDKIPICLGLACHHAPTFHFTEYVLWRLGINEHDVNSISYRGRGWPGHMTVELHNGKKILIPYSSPVNMGGIAGKYFYTLRCSLCMDRINQLSDISFMDAWLPEFQTDKIGTSLIISRSQIGEEIISNMLDLGKLKLSKTNKEAVIRSQGLYYAYESFCTRYHIASILGKRVPIYYGINFASTHFYNLKDAFFHYIRTYVSKKRCLWRIIGCL